MNINPDKVKELVLAFSELDEEYQEKVLEETYKLRLMQGQKNQVRKEIEKYKTADEFQEETEKRFKKRAKEILDFMKIWDNASDTNKAAIFMAANHLTGRAQEIQKLNISISVNQRDISMKEYLEKYLIDVDYDKAENYVRKFFV